MKGAGLKSRFLPRSAGSLIPFDSLRRSDSSIRVTLGEYPLHHLGFGICPLPGVVVYASVLGGEGPTSCFLSCRHSLTRHRHRHSLVGVPVEVPQWRVNRPGAILCRYTPAADHCGGEKLRTRSDDIPCARPTHRLPGYVDAAFI